MSAGIADSDTNYSAVRVCLDLDDVLVDFRGEVCKLHSIDLDDPEIFHKASSQWSICNVVDHYEMWKNLDIAGPKWWANLPFLPWGEQLYHSMKTLAAVFICTDPNLNGTAAHGKIDWINKNLNTRNFLIGSPKFLCANGQSILIDDSPTNCHTFVAQGGWALQWPNSLQLKKTPEKWSYWLDVAVGAVKYVNNKIWSTAMSAEPELITPETLVNTGLMTMEDIVVVRS